MTVNPNWTFEEAQAEHSKVIAADPKRENDPTTPLFQWFALKHLEVCREFFQDGDEFQLMLAIKECAQHDLPLPDWAAHAYLRGYYAVVNAQTKSWDEAFSAPYKKNTNLNATRKKRELELAVFNEVRSILNLEPGTPIDTGLFERVAAKFNIGKTLAGEYYYAAKSRLQTSGNF